MKMSPFLSCASTKSFEIFQRCLEFVPKLEHKNSKQNLLYKEARIFREGYDAIEVVLFKKSSCCTCKHIEVII